MDDDGKITKKPIHERESIYDYVLEDIERIQTVVPNKTATQRKLDLANSEIKQMKIRIETQDKIYDK